jgi:hypothetical protein
MRLWELLIIPVNKISQLKVTRIPSPEEFSFGERKLSVNRLKDRNFRFALPARKSAQRRFSDRGHTQTHLFASECDCSISLMARLSRA